MLVKLPVLKTVGGQSKFYSGDQLALNGIKEGPRTRWMDQLEWFAGGDWMQMAMDEDSWTFLGECFAVADLV